MTVTQAELLTPYTLGTRSGWRRVKFGEIAEAIADRIDNPSQAGVEYYVGLEHLDSGSLKIRRWGTPDDVEATKLRFKPGDIIFGKRRAYQRKVAVAEFEGICSAHAMVLRAREENVVKEFLPFFMQGEEFSQRAVAISEGSLSPTIKWKTLSEQEFVIPTNDEQHRMVEILSSSVEAIHKAIHLIEEIEHCRQTLMHNLFGLPRTAPSGNDGRVAPLSQLLAYASDGPFGSKLKTEHYAPSGARVIRLQNIGDGVFNDDDKVYISDEYYQELSRYSLEPGDIIVAGLGDEAHPVGRVCQIPADLGPAINKADCFCLRADTASVEPDYLLHFLNSPRARMQIQALAQGTTRLRINTSNLKIITVPVPNREEQLAICRTFRELGEAHSEAEMNLKVKRRLGVALREHLLSDRTTDHVQ